MRLSIILLCIAIFCSKSFCQSIDSTLFVTSGQTALQTIENIPSKSLDFVSKKYSKLTDDIQKQSEKLLRRMRQQETKIQKKVQKADNSKAQELFSQAPGKYQELQTKLKAPLDKAVAKPVTEYISDVDSLQTILKFLSQPNLNSSALSSDKIQQIQAVSDQIQKLQGRLQQANEIQQYIRERESQLKSTLSNMEFGKELLGINKELYYYQQQLAEYKALLHDRKKLEEKVFATVRNLPAFQNFMRKHSYLAQLFRLPDNSATTSIEPIPGLQTRASVQTALQQRFGQTFTMPRTSGGGGSGFEQQLQQAHTQLNVLKDKLNQVGGGNSDMTMPDFKPNMQKAKPFLQRLEYGFNMQSERGTSLMPATSDFALTVGYRLSDKKTIGLGASYKMGWGHGFNHIHLSSEGIGLRSYADMTLKGSIWLTGGFEYNYFNHFSNLNEIKNIDVWQRSALLGLEKKYRVGKKNGTAQVLYDFLAGKQTPQAQALKFRVGYTF